MTQTASAAVAVTPSDFDLLGAGVQALFVGVGGDLVIVPDRGTAGVTLKNVADGSVIPIKAKQVLATGTTASSIVALY
jgi:hypothetical protein